MKYDIICYPSVDELIKAVNAKISKGWVCLGGVSVAVQNNYYTFYQAIIKPDKNNIYK